MQLSETLIRNVVEQVLREVGPAPTVANSNNGSGMPIRRNPLPVAGQSFHGRHGVFADVNEGVAAAREAFVQLSQRSMEDRKRIISHIRRISIEQCIELGTMEMEETQIGRLSHKHAKLKLLGERAPGVEFLESQIYSGSRGLAINEHAPFGVIGAITPVTHSLPTITGNAVSMIAAGNSLVVNPHPSGKKVAAEGVRRFNKAIADDVGIDNLIVVIAEPTLETADAIFSHRDVALICVTGGPAVARAALNSGKRAIVAGPGNPPVVVDETADLANAARSIIAGAAFDNNLLCIAEKEVFAVDEIFDSLMQEMEKAGAARLNSPQVDRLTGVAISQIESGGKTKQVPTKEFLGKDASVLAQGAGVNVHDSTELLFGETSEENPFVPVEQMMPFVPFVRARNAEDAIAKAKEHEHGFRHTAIIHSNNLKNITTMGREMDTTLFVANGPCVAGLGNGGEGYLSFSIATPTGEGVTTPLTFTRERRLSIVDDLYVLGK